tara:strand:- start:248 stop:466 length:219 start_codon:yes stop_codon:yes gene_type:complete
MVEHILTPKHKKLKEDEAEKILKSYNISKKQLPRINLGDAAIVKLDPEIGDIIEILRESPTVGKSYFYRVVV